MLDGFVEITQKIIGGVEVRIVDDSGLELPPGNVGMIEVRGDELFSGYLHGIRRNPSDWHRTGDLGEIDWGHRVVAGYYAQEHDNLDVDASLRDNIRASGPVGVQLGETQLRGLLGMFGLSGDKVFQRSGTLSGGEKTKLALAMLMTGRNNLLLLDEPTNNLDPPSREAVANALIVWPGAIVFVSHDTDFVQQLDPTKVLLMPDGDVDYFGAEWLDLVEMS